jgi:hypothetical protein
MSLTEMTIKKADEIIDIVTPLMINRSVDRFYFGYSELKGYDIIDVDNALKLFNAFNYFQKGILQKINEGKIILDANKDNALVMNLCFRLVPDYILSELNKYRYGSHEYISKACELVDESNYLKLLGDGETVESFVRYCIGIGWDDPDYWVKVYYRLGLLLNPEDEMLKSFRK